MPFRIRRMILLGLVLMGPVANAGPQAFDVPRLDGVSLDGAAADWGDRGFRVDRVALHAARGTAVAEAVGGAAAMRIGWDKGGLLLLLTLPRSRVEGTDGQSPTVNLVVRDGRRPLNWWQVMLDLPPRKVDTPTRPSPRLIEHRFDQWVDPREARKELAALAPLAIEACWVRSIHGYALEARVPWGNLGRVPKEGDSLRVQVQVWKGGPSLAWFPYGWSEKCTHYSHRIRAARGASAPATRPTAGQAPRRCPNVWRHGRAACTCRRD